MWYSLRLILRAPRYPRYRYTGYFAWADNLSRPVIRSQMTGRINRHKPA